MCVTSCVCTDDEVWCLHMWIHCRFMYGVDMYELGDGVSHMWHVHMEVLHVAVCVNVCATEPVVGRREDNVIWPRPHTHKPQK